MFADSGPGGGRPGDGVGKPTRGRRTLLPLLLRLVGGVQEAAAWKQQACLVGGADAFAGADSGERRVSV